MVLVLNHNLHAM
jgi:hypothetical protein